MDLAHDQTRRATDRVTGVLELVAAHPAGVRLNRLVGGLDTPKSVVRDIVAQLVHGGYLAEDDGTYTVGPAVEALLPRRWDLVIAARPGLDDLRDRFGETAILSTNIGDSVVNIAVAEPDREIRFSAPLNVPRAIYPSSAGKVFLAHWPARRRDALLDTHGADPRRAVAELDAVRVEGVGYNRGETSPDVGAVACPVVVDGAVVAALGMAGPLARIGDRFPEIAAAVADHAAGLA